MRDVDYDAYEREQDAAGWPTLESMRRSLMSPAVARAVALVEDYQERYGEPPSSAWLGGKLGISKAAARDRLCRARRLGFRVRTQAPPRKLDRDAVLEARRLLALGVRRQTVAAHLGVTPQAISLIAAGRSHNRYRQQAHHGRLDAVESEGLSPCAVGDDCHVGHGANVTGDARVCKGETDASR